MRNKFVILEGSDGAGKTTQAKKLVEKLDFVELRLPDYDLPTGKIIKKHNDEKKANIDENNYQKLMKENYIELLEKKIKPLLAKGKDIVMTRFTPSMKVYSKINGANEFLMDIYVEEMERVYHEVIGKTHNIYKIILAIPAIEAERMISERDKKTFQKREELFESKEMVKKVNKGYKDFYTDNNNWKVVERNRENIITKQMLATIRI